MKEYIKVNGTEYPATTLYINKDRNWGDREVRREYMPHELVGNYFTEVNV